MRYRKRYAAALLITAWVLALTPPLYYAHRQMLENRIVNDYLRSRNLNGLPLTKENAVRVSDQVRREFNTNVNSFVILKMRKRPFLREDSGFLLTHKEGVCGEGTRVIVNLLSRLGFDATRITLYDRNLNPAHALVSVLIDDREFLVDSINSSFEWNRALKQQDLSPMHFRILRYSGNIIEGSAASKAARLATVPKSFSRFMDHFWLYSYEAVPYSKVFSAAGLEVRAFNLNRPHRWISVLAESPNLVMLLVTLIASLLIMCLVHRVMRRIARQPTAAGERQHSPQAQQRDARVGSSSGASRGG